MPIGAALNQAFSDHGAQALLLIQQAQRSQHEWWVFQRFLPRTLFPTLTTGMKTAKTVVSIPKTEVPIIILLRFWKSGFVGAQSADCESSSIDTPTNFSSGHSPLAAV